MSIATGYKRVKNYIYENGAWKLLSRWTSADAVEMSDGTALEDNIAEIEETATNASNTVTEIQNKLGTQCTMVLSGTELTITTVESN